MELHPFVQYLAIIAVVCAFNLRADTNIRQSPFSINADSITLDNNSADRVYDGNVVATQENFRISANRMRVEVDDADKLQYANATGDPARLLYHTKDEVPIHGSASQIEVIQGGSSVRLSQKVRFQQGKDLIIADEITIHRKDGAIEHLVAMGNPVTIVQIDEKNNQLSGSAKQIELFKHNDIAILTYQAQIHQQNNLIIAERIAIKRTNGYFNHTLSTGNPVNIRQSIKGVEEFNAYALQIEVSNDADMVLMTDQVSLFHANKIIHADSISIQSNNGNFSHALAKGRPATIQQEKSGEENIKGSALQIEVIKNDDRIILSEQAVIQQQKHFIHADMITITGDNGELAHTLAQGSPVTLLHNEDGEDEVKVSAMQIEIIEDDDKIILSKQAKVQQRNNFIHADNITIIRNDRNLIHTHAKGSPVTMQQKVEGEESIKGNALQLEVHDNILYLIDQVTIWQGKNEISGQFITIDKNKNTLEIMGTSDKLGAIPHSGELNSRDWQGDKTSRHVDGIRLDNRKELRNRSRPRVVILPASSTS